MDDYKRPNHPRPMTDPCEFCPKQDRCKSQETYKCDLFKIMFIHAWDETVAFLREKMVIKKED